MTDEFRAFLRNNAGGKRCGSMLAALGALEQRRVDGVIVETGCYRGTDGDGRSTFIFAEYARVHGGKVLSIDRHKPYIDAARDALGPLCSYVTFLCDDSVSAIGGLNDKVDLLYLDSFGLDSSGDPEPGQLHQLAELAAAYRLLGDSIVLLDDADRPDEGKTKLSARWLRARGWTTIAEGYQLCFQRRL